MTRAEYIAYLEGWGARLAGETNRANPYASRNGDGVQRHRWYDGWYDRFFWDKYRNDPIWKKRDRK